jgi:hypothetical protein
MVLDEDMPEGEDWRGEVAVFARREGAWQLRQVLKPPSDEEDALFGAETAFVDDYLLVGAPGTGGKTYPSPGAVHIYRETEACICESARQRAPAAAIDAALSQPERYAGWAERATRHSRLARAIRGASA